MSPQSKAHIKASDRYNKKTYDQINFNVKKGEREKIKNRAESKGMSLNAYICSLIEKDMKESKEE